MCYNAQCLQEAKLSKKKIQKEKKNSVSVFRDYFMIPGIFTDSKRWHFYEESPRRIIQASDKKH
jgi:hypothetical protein